MQLPRLLQNSVAGGLLCAALFTPLTGASPSINVALETSFSAAPYLVELLYGPDHPFALCDEMLTYFPGRQQLSRIPPHTFPSSIA